MSSSATVWGKPGQKNDNPVEAKQTALEPKTVPDSKLSADLSATSLNGSCANKTFSFYFYHVFYLFLTNSILKKI